LIVEYLPKLKTFRLQMYYRIHNSNGEQVETERILDSYRTPFWIIDHRWFVRCRWTSDDRVTSIFLYTLPYDSDVFALHCENVNPHAKSTCLSDDDYSSYDRVTTLHYNFSPFNGSCLSHIRFHNVTHLEMTLPFCDRFLSILPRLEHVTSLYVSSNSETNTDLVLSQLQTLIDRTPRLYSLSIGGWSSSIVQEIPLKITSNSIRQLDFQSSHYPSRDRCFSTQQCAAFLSSPLAIQCEVLLIVVDSRRNIFELLNRMPNLRALKVECQLDRSNYTEPSLRLLGQWMRSGYSRAFIDDLSRNEIIRVWIR
jgi:hypothetical protein